MSDMRVRTDRLKAVAGEWDILGPLRHRLISSGQDTSFDRILSPYVLKAVSGRKFERLFDAGCGTGDLTSRLAKLVKHVDGADISQTSINIAKEDNSAKNISYYCSCIENFVYGRMKLYDACIANMLLMDTPDALRVLGSIKTMLRPGATLIITILHPFFYYFIHEQHRDLEGYLENGYSLDNFFITNHDSNSVFRSHFHRPISYYVNILCRLGYTIISLDELAPPKSLSGQYGGSSLYPRFLGIKASTGKSTRG